MLHHLVIGVVFLAWGIADVLRVQLPGVLELIVGGVQVLFCLFSDDPTVTSILLAVMILAAVCILGPYYHWRKQEKENDT